MSTLRGKTTNYCNNVHCKRVVLTLAYDNYEWCLKERGCSKIAIKWTSAGEDGVKLWTGTVKVKGTVAEKVLIRDWEENMNQMKLDETNANACKRSFWQKAWSFHKKMHHHGKEPLGQAQNKGALPCSTSACMCLLGIKLKGGTERLCIYLWGTLADSLLRAVIEKGTELRPLVC